MEMRFVQHDSAETRIRPGHAFEARAEIKIAGTDSHKLDRTHCIRNRLHPVVATLEKRLRELSVTGSSHEHGSPEQINPARSRLIFTYSVSRQS